MTIATKRERLHNYIDAIEDEKIEAMYTIFEEQLHEQSDWWKDDEFVKELDERVRAYESGEVKGIPWEEVKAKVRSNLDRA